MPLVSLQDIKVVFGGPRIFDRLSLQVEPGERNSSVPGIPAEFYNQPHRRKTS